MKTIINTIINDCSEGGIVAIGLFILIVSFILWFTNKSNRSERLGYLALLIYFCGFILYFIGFGIENPEMPWQLVHGSSLIAITLRAMLTSMEMFVSHSELYEVFEEWHHNPIYMTCFAVVHFLAFFLTMLAAINLLGSKLKHVTKKKWNSIFMTKRPLYLFFGVNEASIIAAKKIHDENKEQKPRIFFIEFPEEEGEHLNFESLIGLTSLKHGLTEKINEIGNDVILCYGTTPIHEIPTIDPRKLKLTEARSKVSEYFRTFDLIGLKSLKKFIRKSDVVKIFFLSDNLQQNLQSFEALCSDPFILNGSLNNYAEDATLPKFVIYCHARRNKLNIICENRFLDMNRVEVHIVDSSLLSVHYLKSKLRYCPVSFVDVKDGKADSDFNSMIVGFGETGQDVFEFLYEYGAFESTKGGRNGFHCLAVDEKMNSISERYLVERPSLRQQSDKLELCNMSYQSSEFWKRLMIDIHKLNYIVISLGDDEKGMTLAIDIYNLAIRERKDMRHFKIFVRVYKYSNEKRLNNIASYYNTNNKVKQERVFPEFIDVHDEREEGADGTIVVFGELDEIYNLHYIYNEDENQKNDSTIATAKKFYSKYIGKNDGMEEDTWNKRRKNLLNQTNTEKLYRLQTLKRQESQDMSNSIHIDTKLYLLGLLPSAPVTSKTQIEELDKKYQEFLNAATQQNVSDISEATTKKNYELITSVAKTEHHRWVAAHEILGYVADKNIGASCNEIKKTHGCLYDWDVLAEHKPNILTYDFIVVETSIKVKQDILKTTKIN